MSGPWEKYAQAAPSGPPAFIAGTPDPYKARSEARAADSHNRQITNTQHDNRVTDTRNRIDNPQALRKEFYALPEVKSYKVATQQLAQALGTGSGPQSDLSLTYAFAKAMDPDSVVRESETASISSSQAWLAAASEQVKKQFGMDEAGNYTPAARAALRQQIIRAVAGRNKLYNAQRSQFSALAKRNNIDPMEVVGPHAGAAFVKDFRAYDQKRRAAGANVAPVSGASHADDALINKYLNGGR